MRIGYCRVSTQEQLGSLAAQQAALEAAGCERIFTDVVSGARADRPGLTHAMDITRPGDQLVVTRLDRLGRSTLDTLRTIRDLDNHGVRIVAQDLDLDTGTPAGRLVVTVLAALAEWERDTLRERTRDGLAHARSQGRVGGRPRALTGQAADAALAALRGGMSVADVARVHGVSRWTVARLRADADRLDTDTVATNGATRADQTSD